MQDTEYKPNYAVHPIEHLKEYALLSDLGHEWVSRLEKDGITKKDAKLLAALYRVPVKFLNNLQRNYEETKNRLENCQHVGREYRETVITKCLQCGVENEENMKLKRG